MSRGKRSFWRFFAWLSYKLGGKKHLFTKFFDTQGNFRKPLFIARVKKRKRYFVHTVTLCDFGWKVGGSKSHFVSGIFSGVGNAYETLL